MQKLTDEQLIEQTKSNKNAFGELVDRYEKRLFRYIARTVRTDEENIYDILQNVFIKTYKNINNFDTSLLFSSWIYRIAHNEAIDYLRKHKKQATITLENDDYSLVEIIASEENIPKTLLKKEKEECVRSIISSLDEKYKDILVLKYLEQKSYEEISDILKIPMGTVATLVNRAKKQFTNKLESSNFHI